MRTLEQVLADAREEAAILRKHGQEPLAEAIQRLCLEVTDATEDFLRFVPESNAMLRTGRSLKWLRKRFAEWEAAGHARWNAGNREYRLMILPQRANPSAAYEAGKRDGRAA